MTSKTHLLLRGGAAVAAMLASGAARAEDGAASRDHIVRIGAGAQIVPLYPGADRHHVVPLIDLDFRRAGEPIVFGAPDQSTGIGLLGRNSRIDLGPIVRLQSRRREKDVGAAVGNVGYTVEAGGFVEAHVASWFRLRAEGRKGLGGHRGLVADLSADFVARNGDRTIASIGPRLRLADSRYQRAYFGVTPAVAARTGLPAFAPRGGIRTVGAVAGLLHQLTTHWGVEAYAGYDRLVRDAADSPIVRRFGSRDQLSAGLALTYSFTLRGH